MTPAERSPFPAVLVGGPPHSGKSVLTYSLTQMLRKDRIDHYVLRACPDGEGDFSNEAHPETIKLIRQKGQFSPLYVERVCAGLQKRHLPLLVDVGGKPTSEQEVIFTHCTHAILIAADAEKLAVWRQMIERINATTGCAIEIIAELQSQLDQPDQLGSTDELFGAIIGGLTSYPITALGALFVGVLESFASFFASQFKEVVVFSVLIPVLLWRSLMLAHGGEEETEEMD